MATATAAVGLASGAAKFFEGRAAQKKAEQFIQNFQWQDLQNPFENVQVSTLGADLRSQEAARTTATTVDAIRSGGTRAIAGNMGRAQAQNNLVNREIAANLDQEQAQLNKMAAQQDVVNQNMVEQRQANELQGYGQMMNVGMGMKYGGLTSIANAAGVLGQSIDFGGFTPQVTNSGGGSMQTAGVTPLSTGGMAQISAPSLPNFYTG